MRVSKTQDSRNLRKPIFSPDFRVEWRAVEPLCELHLEGRDLRDALGHPLQRVLRLPLAVLGSLDVRGSSFA